MFILIRDRAVENHPVIGIAALTSSVVQLKDRDDWIGWSSGSFLEALAANPRATDAAWILSTVREGLEDLYVKDFLDEGLLTLADMSHPTTHTIKRLKGELLRSRKAHERYPNQGEYKSATSSPMDADWESQARSFLFRSKRAATLATLLQLRLALKAVGLSRPSKRGLQRLLDSKGAANLIGAIVKQARSRHVGIDMLDISICGAVPPYTHVLGGKLVSLLMASPEIVAAYRAKYRAAPSLIASAMKGALITRKPRLVLMTTTSLYGVASSQYNRLRIPAGALGDAQHGEIRFELLGKSIGWGSYHLSDITRQQMALLVSQRKGGRRVNSIFGEGVNPKLRRLREALDAVGLPSDLVLKHGSTRLVYGLALASNFRDVLLDRANRPKYLLGGSDAKATTDRISEFWRQRWLSNRIERPETLQAVESHSLTMPVVHGARVPTAPDETGLPLFDFDSNLAPAG